MGQGFILPDLWLLWWEDPFLDTPTLPPLPCHPPPIPGAVPTCSQAYLLGGHETCVYICVLCGLGGVGGVLCWEGMW